MQQSLQHDAQLRVDARAFYNDQRLLANAPSFEDAERRRTAKYLEAVEMAQHMRELDQSYASATFQLTLI